MKKALLWVFFGLASTLALSAQNEEKQKDIALLLEISGTAKQSQLILNNMVDYFKKSNPEVPSEFWDAFLNKIDMKELVALVIPIYDRYFTPEEIKNLIAFYQSPLGQKLIQTMPLVTQETMEIGQKWGQQLAAKVIAELKEKGY